MQSILITLFLINLVRLNPLILDEELTKRAEIRAEQLCEDKQWSHDGWKDSFKGLGVELYGENLSRNWNNEYESFIALMNSPAHRQNIMMGVYTKIGIGRADCNLEVQLFTE